MKRLGILSVFVFFVPAALAKIQCVGLDTGDLEVRHAVVTPYGLGELYTRVEHSIERWVEESTVKLAVLQETASEFKLKTIVSPDKYNRPAYIEMHALANGRILEGSAVLYTSSNGGATFTRRLAWPVECTR